MASPDLDAPARVSHLSAAGSPSGSPRVCVSLFLIFSLAWAGAAESRAQQPTQPSQDQVQSQTQDGNPGVAEAARQERARKQNHRNQAKHVYTAEDLKRERILTPEDRAELPARQNQQRGATVAQDAPGRGPSSNSARLPLGELARRLRREKQSRQLERSAEFPLPFADAPALASPKPAEPLLPSVTLAPPKAVLPAPRVVAPSRPFVKRSPFERPRLWPAPPVASRRLAPASPALSPAPRTSRALSTEPRLPPSPPLSATLTSVTVKPGDSLWKLAGSRLGDGRRWQELLALNPRLRHPDLLEVGSEIVVPVSLAPARQPAKSTVRHGDTLSTIAQAQLGHPAAWSCIAHANPDRGDAHLLHQGQLLLLPATCLPE